jgi:conjugative transfer signal peptidase TraF
MGRDFVRGRRTKRVYRTVIWNAFSVFGLALIAIPATGILPPILAYNPSKSAPLGWYRIEAIDEISRGDLVVANLPRDASKLAARRGYLPTGIPVIKTVAALDGDMVCEEDGLLQINGLPTVRVLTTDKAERPLPSPWKACRRLQANEILLLSDRTRDSFDGRYFGAVRKTDIIGRAVWMVSAGQPRSEGSIGQLEGRSECKIKARGANEGSSPCLHIDFYGSIHEGIAPSSERMLNEDYRIGWLHSGELACFPPEQPE